MKPKPPKAYACGCGVILQERHWSVLLPLPNQLTAVCPNCLAVHVKNETKKAFPMPLRRFARG
jgi:hypothetical protein